MTPNEIIAAQTLAFGSRPIRWKRSTGDFVESHCGFWHITPIYGGLTRPESYELWFGASDRKRVGSGQTQRECKDVAASTAGDQRMSTKLLTRNQLNQLLEYAKHIEDVPLAGACMRAIDGDSMYHIQIMERCAAAYAGAHMSDEFKRANRVDNEPGQPRRTRRRKP